jgi:hypothetical protein
LSSTGFGLASAPVGLANGLLGLRAELALSALRPEHRQRVRDVPVGPPFVRRVLVLARLAPAFGAGRRMLVGCDHPAEATPAGEGWGRRYGRSHERKLVKGSAEGRVREREPALQAREAFRSPHRH